MHKLSRREVIVSSVGMVLTGPGGPVQPTPAGDMGFSKLLEAAVLLESSAPFEASFREKQLSLAAKRTILAAPEVREASELLERTLFQGTPSLPPEEDLKSAYPGTALRRLIRLLCLRQYVAASEGRLTEALRCCDLGLQLARAGQSGPMIAGLMGITWISTVTNATASHLERLTPSNCEELIRICRRWLAQPSLTQTILDREERFVRHMSEEEFRKDAKGDVEQKQFLRLLAELFQHQRDAARRPAWERGNPVQEIPGLAASESLRDLGESVARYVLVQDESPTRLRLLACHAMIQRFHWEWNRLPTTLQELTPGSLGIDPFTGMAFQYEKQAIRSYRLSSVGWPASKDEDGEEEPRAESGRVPISLRPE